MAEANEVIQKARALKNSALDARDDGDWDEAYGMLKEAETLLEDALANLEKNLTVQQTEDTVKRDLVAQLSHIRGSRGGFLRRQGKFRDSALAYDSGNDMERKLDETDKPNSYNLLQRLVARILLNPLAAETNDDLEVEGERVTTALSNARAEIARQLSLRGSDAYAWGDLLMAEILLGVPDWHRQLASFAGAAKEDRYAYEVTIEVLDQLRTRAVETKADVLKTRLTEALTVLRSALARMQKRPS